MDIEDAKKVIKIAISFLKEISLHPEEREDRCEEIWIDNETGLWRTTVSTTTFEFLTKSERRKFSEVTVDLPSESVVSVKRGEFVSNHE